MLPKKVEEWLRQHEKGDLQECSWGELKECLEYGGYSCPLAESEKEEEKNANPHQ